MNDARNLLTGAGASVERVDFDQDGFTVTASLGPDRHVWFEGLNCNGAGEGTTCTEFKISAKWNLNTVAEAEAIARKINYNYTSVFADGSSLYLWRMDFTYGGVTREHLRRTVGELIELRYQAEQVIWPSTNSAKPPL